MKAAIIKIEGNWAHFKKPETNNNPLTHDFITKTALIGLIGAVLGIERNEMRPLYPQLSDDLLYGVQILEAVKKESWSFKLRSVTDYLAKSPRQMEFLKNPKFSVAVALRNDRSNAIFENFVAAIERGEARFTPVLGLHNCPANLSLSARGEFAAEAVGQFTTKGFVSAENHKIENVAAAKDFRLGLEKIPTFQNDNFWNLPDKYLRVVYPSENREIAASGKYFRFSDESDWFLV
jgi:CRISPR-associated protein Cas5h